jgi:hypothetical protein
VRSLVLHIFTWIILTAFGLLATGIGLKPSSYLGGMAIGPSPTLVMKDRSVPTIREARNELGSEEYRLIRQYANEYSIDYRLILAIIKQESQFDAEALSGRGATGLMQLMPVTNEEVTENLQMEEFDLVHSNIRGGIYYFAKLMKLFQQSNTDDQVRLALAAYNAGPTRIYDAQELAAYIGDDPDSWSSIQNVLPLLSKRYSSLHRAIWEDAKPRSGFFGSWRQTVNYVDSTMKIYSAYVRAGS